MIELTVAPWPGDRLEPVVEILEPVAVMGRRLEVVARLLAEVVEADPVAFAVRILAVRRQGYRHLRAWGLGEIAGKLVESITSHRPPTSSVGRR